MLDPMPRQDVKLPPTPREAELMAEIEKMRDVVEAAQWARNRLERIADNSWHGDARDFKRSLDGVFLDFDRALERIGSSVPEHLRRSESKEPSNA